MPRQKDLGGLTRRASLSAHLTEQNSELLFLDGGNAFFGPESLNSRGEVVVAAYNQLGYDAVNLSYRDFFRKKEQTLALVKQSGFDHMLETGGER